jgi:hypothetical protein
MTKSAPRVAELICELPRYLGNAGQVNSRVRRLHGVSTSEALYGQRSVTPDGTQIGPNSSAPSLPFVDES